MKAEHLKYIALGGVAVAVAAVAAFCPHIALAETIEGVKEAGDAAVGGVQSLARYAMMGAGGVGLFGLVKQHPTAFYGGIGAVFASAAMGRLDKLPDFFHMQADGMTIHSIISSVPGLY